MKKKTNLKSTPTQVDVMYILGDFLMHFCSVTFHFTKFSWNNIVLSALWQNSIRKKDRRIGKTKGKTLLCNFINLKSNK